MFVLVKESSPNVLDNLFTNLFPVFSLDVVFMFPLGYFIFQLCFSSIVRFQS